MLDSATLEGFTGAWEKYGLVLHPNDTDPKARLAVLVENKGEVDVDFVSLFPEKTWKNRPGGLRADMVEALADLHPGFMRFPGGCIVEGSVLARRYQWKNTIGPVEQRHLLINRWNYEFLHRPTPDYFQSFGLGFFEYFQLCEDIGAQPLPILNCGMACQFNSGELCPMDQLDAYVQDALDLVEFANGPTDSPWRLAGGQGTSGSVQHEAAWHRQRAMGLAVLRALRAVRQGAQGKASGDRPRVRGRPRSWPIPDSGSRGPNWTELHADIIDEHCYDAPALVFFPTPSGTTATTGTGPKVFMGEYAAQSVKTVSVSWNRTPTWKCALGGRGLA